MGRSVDHIDHTNPLLLFLLPFTERKIKRVDITISDPESKSSSGIKLGAFFEWQFLSLSRSKCLFGWIKQAHVKRTKRTPMHKTIGISQNTSNVSEWQTFVCLPFTNNAKRFFRHFFSSPPLWRVKVACHFQENLKLCFLFFFLSFLRLSRTIIFLCSWTEESDQKATDSLHREIGTFSDLPSVGRPLTLKRFSPTDREGRKRSSSYLSSICQRATWDTRDKRNLNPPSHLEKDTQCYLAQRDDFKRVNRGNFAKLL